MPSRSVLRYLVPLAAVLTGAFGLYYLFLGGMVARRGNLPFALFYILFGVGGLSLATALWRARHQLGRPPS